jgi:hypothetical protein
MLGPAIIVAASRPLTPHQAELLAAACDRGSLVACAVPWAFASTIAAALGLALFMAWDWWGRR